MWDIISRDFFLNLSSQWDFYGAPNPFAVPANFYDPSYVPDDQWFKINVPGNWELQGFDIPRYCITRVRE